ncbi:MAG: ribonuclease P protein component [Patescibacteria group bacterium]
MLRRHERLRSGRDIEAVLKKGRRYNDPSLLIWVMKKPQGSFRAAVLCSKKIDKRSVGRNAIKRRIREAVRQVLKPHFPTGDIVISAKVGAKGLKPAQFKNIFQNVFHIS